MHCSSFITESSLGTKAQTFCHLATSFSLRKVPILRVAKASNRKQWRVNVGRRSWAQLSTREEQMISTCQKSSLQLHSGKPGSHSCTWKFIGLLTCSGNRIMPEVPKQMQGNLAHLELEADSRQRNSGLQSPNIIAEMPGSTLEARAASLSILTESSEAPRGHPSSNNFGAYPERQHQGNQESAAEHPSFTPFPPIQNRPPNVPPPDSERESILETARLPVLNSNDPDMQLTWAQDALAYVEIAAQNLLRDSDNQETRPQTPRIEFQLRSDAISVVSFLADQFHPKADFMRGMWLEFGKFNFRMDKKEAYKCYTRAAQKGYARAEYRIGMQFESSNNIAKAIKHYKQGVDAGDSASHYVGFQGISSIPRIAAIESSTDNCKRLGMMTLLGQHGQPLDYEKGLHLIKSAAHTADENAPQGAYVHLCIRTTLASLTSWSGFGNVTSTRNTPNQCSGAVLAHEHPRC